MCGRFTQYTTKRELAEQYDYDGLFDLAPHYNIAPTQQVAAVGQNAGGTRKLATLRWGLIPSWAKDKGIGAKTFNARAETLRERPAFRDAFTRRRCLVPASGFYEWDRQKTPIYFYPKHQPTFAFAGLWDTWRGEGGEVVKSCTIITTSPNGLLRGVHGRMPAIIDPEHYAAWLDRSETDPGQLSKLLEPYPADFMGCHPVHRRVGDVRNDDEACAAPLNPPLPGEAS